MSLKTKGIKRKNTAVSKKKRIPMKTGKTSKEISKMSPKEFDRFKTQQNRKNRTWAWSIPIEFSTDSLSALYKTNMIIKTYLSVRDIYAKITSKPEKIVEFDQITKMAQKDIIELCKELSLNNRALDVLIKTDFKDRLIEILDLNNVIRKELNIELDKKRSEFTLEEAKNFNRILDEKLEACFPRELISLKEFDNTIVSNEALLSFTMQLESFFTLSANINSAFADVNSNLIAGLRDTIKEHSATGEMTLSDEEVKQIVDSVNAMIDGNEINEIPIDIEEIVTEVKEPEVIKLDDPVVLDKNFESIN